MTTVVSIGTTEVKFPETPLITFGMLATSQLIIDREFPRYVEMLRAINPEHPWLTKAVHSAKTRDNVAKVLGLYGIDPATENAQLLQLAAFNHDLGRVIQALYDAGNQEVINLVEGCDHDHGQYTNKLLRQWRVFDSMTVQATVLIREPIAHHTDITTPDRSAFNRYVPDLGDWAYLFTYILRASDKFSTMLGRTAYYVSPEGIAQQIPLMAKECAVDETPFYGETGDINPEAMAAFAENKPFARSICDSYEGYIGAQYLAWVFEIEDPILLREIVASGFVSTIIRYLTNRQVPAAKIQILASAVDRYLANYDIES